MNAVNKVCLGADNTEFIVHSVTTHALPVSSISMPAQEKEYHSWAQYTAPLIQACCLVRHATEKREKAMYTEGNTPVLSFQDICVELYGALQADSI